MRVITGTARGMKLQAPAGEATRPTSDMAKEAVFSMLHFELEQAQVLDLFAGSGQLGIEALSRGAKSAVFVDSAREAQEVIRANLAHTKFTDRAQVVPMQAQAFLASSDMQFDIAFVDPPYGKNIPAQVLDGVARNMRDTGVIICETQKDEHTPETAGRFSVHKTFRYGRAKITVYRIEQEEADV